MGIFMARHIWSGKCLSRNALLIEVLAETSRGKQLGVFM